MISILPFFTPSFNMCDHHLFDAHYRMQLQRTYAPPGSYPDDDYPLPDSRQGAYSSPDQQYMVPPHSASLFPSSSLPSEMQQQHPHDWAPYDQALGLQASMSLQFQNSYPTASPYQPPLSNGPGGSQQNGGPRMTLAGSLDPSTGIFYRTPEHPRLRTAQACEKCRTRKAKCSGEHPSCKRCQNRGLVCEYAKEGRVRGPNRPRNRTAAATAAVGAEESRNFTQRGQAGSSSSRATEAADLPQAMMNALREHDKRLTLTPSPNMSRRDSLSMGEHRSSRPRPPNLKLDTSNSHYRLEPDGSFQGQINGLPHDQRFRFSEDSATIHAASQIPITYQGITPTGIPMDDIETKFSACVYEENRSPSTSSSTSMQGHHSSANPSMVHLQNTYLHGLPHHLARDDNRLRSSASSSPTALAYRNPGDMAVSSMPSMLHYGSGNHSFETLHPTDLKSPTHMNVSPISLSLDHHATWVEMNDVRYGNNREDDQTMMDGGQDAVLHAPGESNNGLHIADGSVGDGNVPPQMQALYPIDLQMR